MEPIFENSPPDCPLSFYHNPDKVRSWLNLFQNTTRMAHFTQTIDGQDKQYVYMPASSLKTLQLAIEYLQLNPKNTYPMLLHIKGPSKDEEVQFLRVEKDKNKSTYVLHYINSATNQTVPIGSIEIGDLFGFRMLINAMRLTVGIIKGNNERKANIMFEDKETQMPNSPPDQLSDEEKDKKILPPLRKKRSLIKK